MKKKQRSFARWRVYLLIIMATTSVVAIFYYQFHAANKDRVEACKTEEPVIVCISSPKKQISSSDTLELKTTIQNSSNNDMSETFTCTHTDPSIVLNKNNLSLGTLCGQAITTKTIKAHQRESFTYKLTGSEMVDGLNTITARWGSYESNEITLWKNEASKNESVDQFRTCQSLTDNIDYSDVPVYCDSINIVLKNASNQQRSCAQWKELFKQISLTMPCDSVMSIGVGYIYVPKESAQRHLADVKALPEVETAYIDNN